MNQPQSETCFVRSDCQSIPGMKRFCHEAMATTFEVIVVYDDDRYARQAAAAAFDEVEPVSYTHLTLPTSDLV